MSRERVLERGGLGVPDVSGSWVFFFLFFFGGGGTGKGKRKKNIVSFFFFGKLSSDLGGSKKKWELVRTVRRARRDAGPAVVPRPAAPQQVPLERVRRSHERARAPLRRGEGPHVPAAQGAVARVGEEVRRN